jgi:hypothetical protein
MNNIMSLHYRMHSLIELSWNKVLQNASEKTITVYFQKRKPKRRRRSRGKRKPKRRRRSCGKRKPKRRRRIRRNTIKSKIPLFLDYFIDFLIRKSTILFPWSLSSASYSLQYSDCYDFFLQVFSFDKIR